MDFLTLNATWIGIAGGFFGSAVMAENIFKDDFRKKLSNWLNNKEHFENFGEWPNFFAGLFDKVFGKKHFTFRCFFFSSVFSVLSVLLYMFILSSFIEGVSSPFQIKIWGFLKWTAFINFIPDYISLLESRYVINLLIKEKKIKMHVSLLLLDVVLTAFVWFLSVMIVTSLTFSFNFEQSWLKSIVFLWNSFTALDFLNLSNPAFLFFYINFSHFSLDMVLYFNHFRNKVFKLNEYHKGKNFFCF